MRVFFFFLFLTVVAGLVAAGGDRMGHLAARRKLRFGKMRPRHVSTMIAVISGIVISLVTSLVLFTIDSNLREALTRYDTVKQGLASAQLELQTASQDTRQAVQDRDKAQVARDDALSSRDAAVAELTALQDELSMIRGQLAGAAMELDTAQQELAQADADVKALNLRKARLEKDIADYKSVEADLRQLITLARSDVESLESGKFAILRDTNLYYQTITPADSDELESRLSGALLYLSDLLAGRNLKLDPAMPGIVKQFAADNPLDSAAGETVVVFRTAANVLENGEVPLALEAVPLTPLVQSGEELMTVMVDHEEATISWRGRHTGNIQIAEPFDADSFTDFTSELWYTFSSEAGGMGFLPDLASGEIATPIGNLASVFDDLLNRQRPFTIQFVARGDADALQGLADCEIYISKWPPEQ